MKRIIISKCSGRFANQLWMFANVLAFAHEKGYDVHAPSFFNYAQLFQYWNESKQIKVPANNADYGDFKLKRKIAYWNNRLNFITNTYLNINLEELSLISKLPIKGRSNRQNNKVYTRCYFDKPEYEWLAAKILSRKTVMFQGFMFCSSVEKMKQQGDFIRSVFTPQQAVIDKMNWLKSQRPADAFLVGVHMRKGDYRQYRNGKYFYDNAIYVKQMQHIKTLIPSADILFFICSDEPINESDFSAFNFVTNKNATGVEDMYMLSVCQYICAPPSTYSKWASYYGNVPLYTIEDATALPALTDFTVRYNHYY